MISKKKNSPKLSIRKILQLSSVGLSVRQIVEQVGSSKSQIARLLSKCRELGMTYESTKELTDTEISELFAPKPLNKDFSVIPSLDSKKQPDFEYIHSELKNKGVTLSLLHHEYEKQCAISGERAYKYSRYCDMYSSFSKSKKIYMHFEHPPGERMEVDWAGTKMDFYDSKEKKDVSASIFLAVLCNSKYAYVEAFMDETLESWVTGHINTLNYYEGSTKILAPDNLLTGITKNTKDNLIINRTYEEMANHYGMAVIPARVKKPKDKPNIEKCVKDVNTWIIAALRDETYFSLDELNSLIRIKIEEYNHRTFRGEKESRWERFSEEKQFLQPLPKYPYVFGTWKVCTVHFNYHIYVDKMYYSVIYKLIKKEVYAKSTAKKVEIYYDGNLVAEHDKLHGRTGQYRTNPDHMPPNHKAMENWNGYKLRNWASSIGPSTYAVINQNLVKHKVEQQGYKSCMAILSWSIKYNDALLEKVCSMAVDLNNQVGFKTIELMIVVEAEKLGLEQKKPPKKVKKGDRRKKAGNDNESGMMRGKKYYNNIK
jgi:transposase